MNASRSPGLWVMAWRKLREDRVGMVSMAVVAAFLGLVALAQLGLIASDWQREVATPFAPPHWVGPSTDAVDVQTQSEGAPLLEISDVDPLASRYEAWAKAAAQVGEVAIEKSTTRLFGADRIGRDVLAKAIKGAQVSITVGVAAALMATLIGTLLGALAGYFGGVIDDVLEWLYNVFNSVPYVLLIFALAAVFKSGPMAACSRRRSSPPRCGSLNHPWRASA